MTPATAIEDDMLRYLQRMSREHPGYWYQTAIIGAQFTLRPDEALPHLTKLFKTNSIERQGLGGAGYQWCVKPTVS